VVPNRITDEIMEYEKPKHLVFTWGDGASTQLPSSEARNEFNVWLTKLRHGLDIRNIK